MQLSRIVKKQKVEILKQSTHTVKLYLPTFNVNVLNYSPPLFASSSRCLTSACVRRGVVNCGSCLRLTTNQCITFQVSASKRRDGMRRSDIRGRQVYLRTQPEIFVRRCRQAGTPQLTGSQCGHRPIIDKCLTQMVGIPVTQQYNLENIQIPNLNTLHPSP